MAEKQRRDNLNSNISTMASLVPAVAGSSRRMDKISILRLAAAFLRTQYTLGPGPDTFLPRQYDFDLEQYVIENVIANAGFFLVVTMLGKIVYISRYIEHQLGHAQHELLGRSLYNFICPEDCEELERNLTPDDLQNSTSKTVRVSEDNSSSSDDPASPRSDRNFTAQRRSFNIRMSQKALNKREHGQYECLQISGQLRLANACSSPATNHNRSRHRDVNSTSNDIVFVGVARLVKKRTMTELSLLEATKDEYVTRHLVDGRIIFCDHRISVVAGYMTEEVSGLSAFKFMHKEDVRWTMIALRQMYDRGEGFGSSCYRLLSKTGQFIYLRTHGYLEFDKSTQTVESFVCVNTLVSEEEGAKLIKEMKDRFSATISGPARAMIAPSTSSTPVTPPDTQRVDAKATVEDSRQLEDAITHLISDLPSPSVSEERQSPSPLPNNQYYKAAVFAQGMPPAAIQASKIGIKSTNLKSPPQTSSRDKNESYERRGSISNNLTVNRMDSTIGNNNNVAIAGPSFMESGNETRLDIADESRVARSPESRISDLENSDLDMEENTNVQIVERTVGDNVREDIYDTKSTNIGHGSTTSVFKVSNNLQEKRTSRKQRVSHSHSNQDKDQKRCNKTIGRRNNSHRIESRVSSTCGVVTICERLLPQKVKLAQSTNDTGDNVIADETRLNARKRSGSRGESTDSISKRKANEMNKDCASSDDQADGGMIYYANADSPNLGGFVDSSSMLGMDDLRGGESSNVDDIQQPDDESQIRVGISMDLGAGSSRLVPIEIYRHLNPSTLINSSSTDPGDQQTQELDDDLRESKLSPSLDADPDLMKTIADLQTVMCNGKTIDEANVNQFTASDQAVNEGIRRSQFQLEKSIAMRESQLRVLKRDLDNPALQAQRENFTQLEAEHNKQKQMLKTLQQDHLNLQVNVQHNVGV